MSRKEIINKLLGGAVAAEMLTLAEVRTLVLGDEPAERLGVGSLEALKKLYDLALQVLPLENPDANERDRYVPLYRIAKMLKSLVRRCDGRYTSVFFTEIRKLHFISLGAVA